MKYRIRWKNKNFDDMDTLNMLVLVSGGGVVNVK